VPAMMYPYTNTTGEAYRPRAAFGPGARVDYSHTGSPPSSQLVRFMGEAGFAL